MFALVIMMVLGLLKWMKGTHFYERNKKVIKDMNLARKESSYEEERKREFSDKGTFDFTDFWG